MNIEKKLITIANNNPEYKDESIKLLFGYIDLSYIDTDKANNMYKNFIEPFFKKITEKMI